MSDKHPSTLGPAVVTGASSGIGKVYAERLAERGYNLLLVARRADRLQSIASDLQARFAIRVENLVVDLTEPAGVFETMQKIEYSSCISLAAIGQVDSS